MYYLEIAEIRIKNHVYALKILIMFMLLKSFPLDFARILDYFYLDYR